MMLRVVLFEVYRRYRLRLAPGATVMKNAVVTTKPAAVPVIRVPREATRPGPGRPAGGARRSRPARSAPAAPEWGQPTEIPPASAYRHLVIAYGSNFGANKELAERFAERSDFHGYTSDVITLNELADAPPRTEPWLLVVMTSTYTSNPPSNATAFRAWLERTAPGTGTWRNCRYLVWGLGNSQWNAFLAFPRYVHDKLAELGATPLAELGFGDVGSPVWERLHADWNSQVWPVLLELSGARPTAGAAERVAAEARGGRRADRDRLEHRDAQVAATATTTATEPMPRPASVTSIMRRLAAGRHPVAGDARARDPHQRGRRAHRRGARPGLPGTPARRRAEADAAAGHQPAARRHLPGRRPPRRVPEERRGAGRAARPAPRRRPRRAVHGAEDDERAGRAEGRRAPGPQRAHQPRRHRRPPGRAAARPAAGQGGRPGRAVQADGDQGRPGHAGRPGFAAARGDRNGRLRRAPAAGRVPVLLAEHLRVPPGGAAAAAALLLGELEPAGARRGRRPADRRRSRPRRCRAGSSSAAWARTTCTRCARATG